MLPPKCPRPHQWLEWVTIPEELGRLKRFGMRLHKDRCTPCREKVRSLEEHWTLYQVPDWDVTSSMLRVFGRLQKDETLILKGWKLGKMGTPVRKPPAPARSAWWWASGMGSAAVSLGLVGWVLLGSGSLQRIRGEKTVTTVMRNGASPLAQIRYENQNRVRIQYVRPELIQSIQFETSRGGRR